MFTGIIETTGKIRTIEDTGEGKVLTVEINFPEMDSKPGDSIAINGVCLTVTKIQEEKLYSFYASYKTLELTNLGKLGVDNLVNTERAVKASQRLGGHIVQGHVDGIGKVIRKEIRDGGKVYCFIIECSEELARYFIERGSIAVDGISLTIVSCEKSKFELVLIPETIEKTNAKNWMEDYTVNLETDILARYVEKLMKP
ncbi:MAG: riboflavin synthase [Leptospiraceae bacterium]|nr:riboflavin synthase [Leptospiraceae bacterium]MCP5502817.1 riboflavin synthase [Leptospiraceae bacterium]